MNERRIARIEQQIKERLAIALQRELADPRLGFVTISRVEVDRELHIIIFANRRILKGEELSYDYKFEYEEENRLPCLCGATNCRKWMT